MRSDAETTKLEKLAPPALLLALIGGFATIAGLVASPAQMLGSYVFAFVFWLTLVLGCLGLSLLHHTIRPSWGVSILRVLEAGGGWQMLLTFAVLLIPIFLGRHVLYEWTHLDEVAKDPVLRSKTWYLSESGWVIRAVIYFVIWVFFAYRMRSSTTAQDESGNSRLEAVRSSWGAVGTVAFFLTATFAFVDWTMSLEPHWFSSMYPLWFIVSSGLGALAFATLVLGVNANRRPFNEIVSPQLTKDLGNLLFAATMLWGYTSISQYLIIWNGNIPEFTHYFVRRSDNWWNMIGLLLCVGQFFVPFFALLAPRTKRTPLRLAKIAGWILVMHLFDVYFTIVPAVPFRPVVGESLAHAQRATYSPMPLWSDPVAFVTIGAIWFLVFALVSKRAPILVKYDKRLQEALAHAH